MARIMASHYCKKCGRIVEDCDFNPVCECCGSNMYPIPEEYLEDEFFIKEEQVECLREELVKTSPEFEQTAYDQRDEILKKQNEEYNRNMALLSRHNAGPECPTCHSKNIQRISGVERGVSILGLGIFSNKINKSYKCKNCGYTW